MAPTGRRARRAEATREITCSDKSNGSPAVATIAAPEAKVTRLTMAKELLMSSSQMNLDTWIATSLI